MPRMKRASFVLFGWMAAVSAAGCGNNVGSGNPSSTGTTSTAKPNPAPSQKPDPSAKPPTKDVPTATTAASAAPSGSASADTPSSGSGGGTNTTGFDTPEALGKAMADAFGDPSKLAGLFPADSVLDGSFDCKDKGHFHVMIRESIKQLQKELKDVKGPFEFVKADPPSGLKTLAKGDEGEGCTTKEAVEMAKWRVTLKAGGKEDDGGVEMMKLGGKWYPIGM